MEDTTVTTDTDSAEAPVTLPPVTPTGELDGFADNIDPRLNRKKIALSMSILRSIHTTPKSRSELEVVFPELESIRLGALRSSPEWYAAERSTGLVSPRPIRTIDPDTERPVYRYGATVVLLEGDSFEGVMSTLEDALTRMSRYRHRASQFADQEAGVALTELLSYHVEDAEAVESIVLRLRTRLERIRDIATATAAEAEETDAALAAPLVTADA